MLKRAVSQPVGVSLHFQLKEQWEEKKQKAHEEEVPRLKEEE